MLDSEYFDELEIQDAEEREILLLESLARHLATTREDSPYYQDLLKGVDVNAIKTRADLATLPITAKSDLSDLQKTTPPLAGMTNMAPTNFLRIFQSPGPTYEPEGSGKDWWRMARALYGAGVRPGDIIHNTFSYHMTPAGMMIESGAQAIGCTVVPAGTGQSEQQVQAIAHIRPNTYTGTPSFLKILLEKARETGADVSCLSKALVSGEALPDGLRREFQDAGIQCFQAYASADLGLIAYESKSQDGLIVDERLIVEIVRPGTGDPVKQGEIGEVVVTSLNRDYPLIRFATGDLSSVMEGPSPCGRTAMRLSGWKGRADQSTKVRGMFVTPKQIGEVVKRHPEIAKARLVVDQTDGADQMTLLCEVAGGDDNLAPAITETLKNLSNLKGKVEITAPDSLPNDGLVIEDKRTP
ncbi:MAG: AMP-binding protein [Alphaproteobacteria bacterium]|jgi:phenylacetate-CoA ligase|nr:AMP-binding protein [Alphaproteobacteria bacterium]MBT7942147.1 AMP-binding protein [Alphaproteobacteria bacterium]